MNSPQEQSPFDALDALAFAESQEQSGIKGLNFGELQERADMGEISFADIGRACWNELCIYIRIVDEIYELSGAGERWQDHHDAIELMHSQTWHVRSVRGFERLIYECKNYDWMSEVFLPLEKRLKHALESGEDAERAHQRRQALTLLEQAYSSYHRFIVLKCIGEGMIEDFFDESRYALRQQAELERANANLEKALQLERQLRHAEVTELRAENPFNLPLGAQNFEIKEIEAAARQNGSTITLRQLRKHLANWRGADREKGEKAQLERAELEVFLRYLSQKQRAKP